MKIFTFVIILFSLMVNAQTKKINLKIDHQALIVNDLKKSGDFYTKVLGFEEIENASGGSPKRWFKNSEGKEIHLIYREKLVDELPKDIHMAYKVDDLISFIDHLKNLGIEFSDWPGNKNQVQLRKDGFNQIYIQDPTGYWIEINDVK